MGSDEPVFRWRKSSFSGGSGECIELGRAKQPRWRKSSFSGESGQCVEMAWPSAVRDSKHPDGPVLRVDTASLIRMVKAL
jgi:uncharacterized protein DUF397